MEIAEPQITVPVRLDGKDPTVTSAYPYLDVIMVSVRKPLNAIAMKVGKEHTVTFPAATTAQMETASIQMNVSV